MQSLPSMTLSNNILFKAIQILGAPPDVSLPHPSTHPHLGLATCASPLLTVSTLHSMALPTGIPNVTSCLLSCQLPPKCRNFKSRR